MVRISNIDKLDMKIIEILSNNSRMKNTEIGKILKISETAVRKRIKKLEKLGIIKRYSIEIDYKKVGLIVSLTGIDVEPEKLMKSVEELKKIKGIRKIWLTTGDHMIMVEIVAKNTEELSEIHSKIEKIEGTKRICPAIILDRIL